MNSNKKFPILKTERLILRPPQEEDIQRQFAIFQDEEVQKYLGMENSRSLEFAKVECQWFQNLHTQGKGVRWIIALKETDECIGDIGFHDWDAKHFKCEMGYKLDSKFWQKGFMSEAASAALSYSFTIMKANRIEALVDVRNLASQRLLEKSGFSLEGILRDYEFEYGNFVDLQIWSLLKKEWKGLL
jgi:ribosomal-protein-alanine N-acetyltransferase